MSRDSGRANAGYPPALVSHGDSDLHVKIAHCPVRDLQATGATSHTAISLPLSLGIVFPSQLAHASSGGVSIFSHIKRQKLLGVR